MARPNKVWFRKDTGWWMVTLCGKKIRLAEGRANRKTAEQKFHAIKAVEARPAENSDARVADIIDRFLQWSNVHRSSETNRNHLWYGQSFCEHAGFLKATELRPHNLTRWIDKRSWGQTTQRNARRSIYRAFAWAVEEGLLTTNPLQGMKCPAALTRRRAMSDAEFRALLRASRRDFKIFLFALRMTGCRPKEARTLTWENVSDDRWILTQHKTAYRTHKPRIVYLNRAMQRLMSVLRRCSPSAGGRGNVFLSARGQAWTVNALRLRVQRIKLRTGLAPDLCCYHARHAFGTSAVINGVDLVTVAEMMGHRSLEMVQRVYVHLSDQHRHLQAAVDRATRLPGPAKPVATDPNSTA